MQDSSPQEQPLGASAPADSSIPYRRALVVANPIAGRGAGARTGREVEAGLRERGIETRLHLTSERGDAFRRLRSLEEGTDLVVSVGGDGTLREVLAGLVDPAIPIGVIPLGTANVLALELGLSRDIHRGLEVICAREVQALDVLDVDGHLSFLVVGAGFDAAVVRRVDRDRKGPITRWDYTRAVLSEVAGYEGARLAVEVDGQPVEGEFGQVLVSNGRGYAGLLRLAEDARLDDGQVEVYLFPAGSAGRMFARALRGVVGRLPAGDVRMVRGRRVRIDSDRPVPYQVDGDARGETPVEIRVTGVRYRILVAAPRR